jgi:hypothetical protein
MSPNTKNKGPTWIRIGVFTRRDGLYSDYGICGIKQSVPETVSSKQDYKIKGEYKATKTLSLSLGYLFELYNVKDFAHDNVPLAAGQDSNQTNILLGDSSQDYKAHVVTLMAKYKF